MADLYNIIEATSRVELVQLVNIARGNGWDPHGAPQARWYKNTCGDNKQAWWQAVIQRKEPAA